MNQLRAAWRQESNRRDLAELYAAGYVRMDDRFFHPRDLNPVPVVFEETETTDETRGAA